MIAGTTFECDRCGHVRPFAVPEEAGAPSRPARAAHDLAEQSGWAITDAVIDPERVLCPRCVAYLQRKGDLPDAEDIPDPEPYWPYGPSVRAR